MRSKLSVILCCVLLAGCDVSIKNKDIQRIADLCVKNNGPDKYKMFIFPFMSGANVYEVECVDGAKFHRSSLSKQQKENNAQVDEICAVGNIVIPCRDLR